MIRRLLNACLGVLFPTRSSRVAASAAYDSAGRFVARVVAAAELVLGLAFLGFAYSAWSSADFRSEGYGVLVPVGIMAAVGVLSVALAVRTFRRSSRGAGGRRVT